MAIVKVLRDTSDRPYAFVQYTNDADARRALNEGQHSVLNGRTIRCEPAKVNRTLYISTCHNYEVSFDDITQILSKYGEIEQIFGDSDSTYKKSSSNGAWFCQFAYRDDAIRAYANLRLSPDWIVEWAQNIEHHSEEIAQQEVEIDKCSIFVGQLDVKVTKELLSERFSRHGKISEIILVIRPGNNFAFIKFLTENAAAAAVERENHAVFMDRTMHVQYRELHHKKNRQSSQTPRLSLAPPPVNLPVRRASTGSGFSKGYERAPMGHFGAAPLPPPSGYRRTSSNVSMVLRNKLSGSRSVSFTSDRAFHAPRFIPGAQLYEPDFSTLNRLHIGMPKDDDSAYAPTDKTTPLSSPSDHTIDSSAHDEAKSMFTATSVSASDHNELGPKHPQRRSIPPGIAPPPPSSSYYYYAYPKDYKMQAYDNGQAYMPYAPYPCFYPPEAGMVDFPPPGPPGLGNPLMPQGAYYMYYGMPQTPFNEGAPSPPGPQQHAQFADPGKTEELDY